MYELIIIHLEKRLNVISLVYMVRSLEGIANMAAPYRRHFKISVFPLTLYDYIMFIKKFKYLHLARLFALAFQMTGLL